MSWLSAFLFKKQVRLRASITFEAQTLVKGNCAIAMQGLQPNRQPQRLCAPDQISQYRSPDTLVLRGWINLYFQERNASRPGIDRQGSYLPAIMADDLAFIPIPVSLEKLFVNLRIPFSELANHDILVTSLAQCLREPTVRRRRVPEGVLHLRRMNFVGVHGFQVGPISPRSSCFWAAASGRAR